MHLFVEICICCWFMKGQAKSRWVYKGFGPSHRDQHRKPCGECSAHPVWLVNTGGECLFEKRLLSIFVMQASNVNLICIFLYRTLWTCVKLPLWVIRLVEQPSLKVYVRKSNSSTYQTDSSPFLYCKRTFLNRPHYMTQTYNLWLHSCQIWQKLRPVSQTVQLVKWDYDFVLWP